ncbi:hypothetical protein pdam_00001198 [Pocillopora damicornis]|uniref:Uncharacterized protein n=1 Tax=Pocillopora damicornis TaxID=46731 RepID=A0A3M6TKX4_POCDA|nr:hypothetical protein pdam_00001198 [Pocillopora damicornis]
MYIQELLSDAINGAKDDILKEAGDFEYVFSALSIPSNGHVKEKAAVTCCQDQIKRMVVNKLQGEIKQTLTMIFRSRDLFLKSIGWIYKAICNPIDTLVKTISGEVPVGSKKWKTNTIKDMKRETVLGFAPSLAFLEMLAYGVMDRGLSEHSED